MANLFLSMVFLLFVPQFSIVLAGTNVAESPPIVTSELNLVDHHTDALIEKQKSFKQGEAKTQSSTVSCFPLEAIMKLAVKKLGAFKKKIKPFMKFKTGNNNVGAKLGAKLNAKARCRPHLRCAKGGGLQKTEKKPMLELLAVVPVFILCGFACYYAFTHRK